MKRITIVLGILTIFLIALKTWGFSFGSLFGGGGLGGGTVPVTDSQLKAVNSVLDAIETTLTEELKNINTNLYNLLKVQYEDFFKQNYQDKILRTWDLQDRLEDYQTLLKDLSDFDNQREKLEKYIENAQFAGAFQTLNDLPNLITCLPDDQRFLAEEYISSTFAYYGLSQFGLSQLSLIPTCEEVQPNFGTNIISQKPISQPKGFLSGLFANILKPFSIGGNFMLAQAPTGSNPSLPAISVTPRYNDTVENMVMDGFYDVVGNTLDKNIKNNLGSIPDTRNVVIPVKQVRTDDGDSVTLSYRTLVDAGLIYDHQQELNAFIEQSLPDFDFDLAFSTDTFATGSSATNTKNIPEICKKLTAGEAKPLNPQIACVDALANFNVSLKDALDKKLQYQKRLADIVSSTLDKTQRKIQDLKNSPTTTECQGYKKRLEELEQYTSSTLVHIATVTANISDVIDQLTGININQQIEQISSTRAYINREYRNIINNVNSILQTFKLRGIKGGDLFGGLPLDFLGEIMTTLEGHNALLGLTKIDELTTKVDEILKSAGNIAGALGQSTSEFNNLRSRLRNAVKPISNSVLVKDYFEIYGIQVEVANIERDMQNGCRNQVVKRNQQRFYALKGNNNYFSLANFQKNNRTVKKIEPIQSQEKLTKGQNFFQKLLAKIFSPKVVEINLR